MPGGGAFGELTPLLAPRSVAVVGASDREGNLGGLAVKFLGKFGYRGPVWPVNTGQTVVAGPRSRRARPCSGSRDTLAHSLTAPESDDT